MSPLTQGLNYRSACDTVSIGYIGKQSPLAIFDNIDIYAYICDNIDKCTKYTTQGINLCAMTLQTAINIINKAQIKVTLSQLQLLHGHWTTNVIYDEAYN